MSRKRKIWVVVSLVAALIVLIPLGLRWRAQWNLNAYRKKLIASGEKLTVEELAPKGIPNATNTALFLRLASTIKPGVARVAWRQTQLKGTWDLGNPNTNLWPALTAAVRTNAQTLDEFRPLVNAGGIDFIENSNQIRGDDPPYFVAVKELPEDLTASAILALHESRMKDAFQYLRTCVVVSHLTSKRPTIYIQVVRYSCITTTAGAYWETLQAKGWTDDQLAQLQRLWDETNILAAAEASLKMERAQETTIFQLGRFSRQGMADTWGDSLAMPDNDEIWHDFLLNARTGLRELFTSYPRYWGWKWIWSFQDEQHCLESMQVMINFLRDAQRHPPILNWPAIRITTNSVEKPEVAVKFDVAESMTDGIIRFVVSALRTQTVEGIVRTAIALERYRLAHHAYPATLRALVPELLQHVPVDCMDGHDLRYRLNPDGTYLLYSVGDDGVDNGGDARPKEGSSSSFWYYGRDLVWPRPATDEEVQAYEAKQNEPKARGKR